MGQITIKISNQENRGRVVSDANRAGELLSDLDKSVEHGMNNGKKLTRQQVEDLQDYLDGKKAMDEMRSTGTSYTVDDLRKKYGIA